MIKDKEYIKECDCKEIQTLKKWNPYNNWRPTGDELDGEIVKTIKGKKQTYYFIADNDTEYYAEIKQMYRVVYSKYDNNPLIAKIKLLKQILKESE